MRKRQVPRADRTAELVAELQRVHRRLSVKLFELHNLIDISRDLVGSSPEAAIQDLVLTTVMGHFVVSRCALYLDGPRGLARVSERGLRPGAAPLSVDSRGDLASLTEPKPVAELPAGPLRLSLEQARLVLAVPLVAGARVEGLLAIGERASGTPFSEEDREMAQALARQALGALENARLRRVREEKERQDRELQLAREIQQSLFPPRPPELAGFELAALSRPCYEVGGDAYDWIPLGKDRLALVIADVAGKGTPASLLMASVHAFLQALAGTVEPGQTIGRLNRFLYANTQASRFVTLCYAELDAARRRIRYVNAGHVPPYRLATDGSVSRLRAGGPALGLLDEAAYEVGELDLASGDVVAMVTDGVTEAMRPPEDHEFGDGRVCDTLRRASEQSALAMLESLVAAVSEWSGAEGFADDLTALVLKAR